jgi:hypothetical protein
MFSCKNIFKFQTRETCYKEHSRIKTVTIYIHRHAHLDLRIWHFSPKILILTLQYMQCKYVLTFIPTWAPHKILEVGKKKASHWCLGENPKIPHILSDLRVPQKEKVSYDLFSKNLKIFLQLTWLKEKGDLFQVVPFFNRLKFHGRHFKSCRAYMTRNGFIWMSCPKVMS